MLFQLSDGKISFIAHTRTLRPLEHLTDYYKADILIHNVVLAAGDGLQMCPENKCIRKK